MSIRTLLLPALLLSGVDVAAQTTLSITAATPLGSRTSSALAGDTFVVTAQGQTIGSYPNNVFQSTSQSPGGDHLSATTIVYPTQPYNGGAGFNFFERATARAPIGDAAGSSASPASTGAGFAGHGVTATFGAAPGTAGVLRFDWRNNLTTVGPNGTAFVRVDVDADGTFEVAQSAAATITLPYTFGPSGQVDVYIECACRSDGDGQGTSVYTWTELWSGFLPDQTATCTFTNYGQGCAGAQLAGNELVVGNTRTIFMLGTGCWPSSPVIVAIGDQQLSLPLLSGCSLLSNASTLELVTADASGNATTSWNVPTTAVGTSFVQFLPIAAVNGLLAVRASNGVRLDCTN
ncbi:MAG: hypothetical protein ACE37K_20530 [Planctomycetota bacterium]